MEILGAIAAIATTIEAFEALGYSLDRLPNQYDSLTRSYGRAVAFFLLFFLRDTATRYEGVESLVLQGENDNVLAFKQAVTDECNMTAVAVCQCLFNWSSISKVIHRLLSLPKWP